MFDPAIYSDGSSQRLIDVDNPVARAYFEGLRPVDASEVGLMELLYTLYHDAKEMRAAVLGRLVEYIDESSGFYRDAADNLIVRHTVVQSKLSLLWPVRQLVIDPTEATIIHGSGTAAYVLNSGVDGIVPLAAVATDSCGYGWGRTGTGPLNLYRALVYAVSQEVAPIIPYQLYEHPQSLVGWITRQPQNNDFLVTWPEIVRLVNADAPVREAVKRAKDRAGETRVG